MPKGFYFHFICSDLQVIPKLAIKIYKVEFDLHAKNHVVSWLEIRFYPLKY